jgi:uncharacterized cupin superfamily protein
MAYTLVHIDDVEPSGRGGVVRFVRRALGVEAFGINRFDLPANREGFEHDEAGTDQEEVSVVIAGSGQWRVDGEEVAVREGSFIRIDAGSTRCPVAGPDGLSFISIGSPRGAF